MIKPFFILLSFLLLAPLISSADIIIKDSFDQGETFMAKTSGSFFSSVSEENVFFYKGHVKTSVVHGVEKIGSDFYIYGQLSGKSPGNYSVAIENAKYYNGSRIETMNLEKNFTISDGTADFSIDKAAIATNQSFSINVKNLKDNQVNVRIGET